MGKASAASIIVLSLGVLFTGCPGSGTALTASFTATPTFGTVPLTVTFTDTSTGGDSSITQWLWDFGDGSTSAERRPSHTYTAFGSYTVSLTVTTSTGNDIRTKTDYITVTNTESGVWYVKPDGSGNGTSWDDAFGSLQDAVNAASAWDGGEVWVAGGTYSGKGGETHILYIVTGQIIEKYVHVFVLTEAYTVRMKTGVYLYGGFAGTETERDARDWEANQTIIDGEAERICVYGANNAALDGFVLQNGYGTWGGGMLNVNCSPTVAHCAFAGNTAEDATDEGVYSGRGGGMCNYDSTSPTVSDCTFTGNSGEYGGGMCNWPSSSPKVINCTFTENTARCGGAMYDSCSSSPTITDCAFTKNTANGGGAMENEDSSCPTITNCVFTENTANDDGGGMFNWHSSAPTVTGCTFTQNTARQYGGGMYNKRSSPTVTDCVFAGNTTSATNSYGGGMFNSTFTSTTVTNCTFTENTAAYGGGMCNYGGSSTVAHCAFAKNTAERGGGMCNNSATRARVTNCTFTENTATYYGGAMYNTAGSSPTVMNCTFTKNKADEYGGGIYNYNLASPRVTNCILWNDSALSEGNEIYNYIGEDYSSSATVTYSCVEGTWDGTGNIDADPLFTDAANGDYSLTAGSSCIDAGTADGAPDTDILGIARPQGSGYDMGAYEYAGR